MLFGGLAGLCPTGTDSGVPEGVINVSLIDADSDTKRAQAEVQKKLINVPVKQAKTDQQKDVGAKTGTSPIQVIGSGRVEDIVTSPDGKLFAVRTPFGLELRRPDSNQPPVTVDTTGHIKSPTFSRDGRFLVCNGGEQLKVWDIEKQETVATHSFDSLKSTLLFDIGLEFATELDNKVVSDDLERVFEEHGIRLGNPYFPRGAPRWQLADQDGRRIFDIREAGDKLSVYALHERRWLDYLNIAHHPEMKEVALGLPWQDLNGSTFKIVFVDPISGAELRSFEWSDTHGLPIYAMQYSPDGEQLVIFEYDKYNSSRPNPPPPRLVFLNPQDGKILHELNIQDSDAGLTFAYSPGSQWFAFRAWREKRIDVIDTLDWQVRKTFTVRGGQEMSYVFPFVYSPDPKTSISFSPDSRFLALGAMVWDFRTGDTVHAGVYRATSQFLDDTHLLISDGASVRTLDVTANRLVERVKLQHGILSDSAYFLPDDDTILTQGWWHTSVWKASTGSIVDPNVFAKYLNLAFSIVSPINDHVASVVTAQFPESSSRKDGSIYTLNYEMLIWSAQKREVVQRISPHLDLNLLGSLTDGPDGKALDSNRQMQRSAFLPYVLAFSPSGEQLAVGESTGFASLWDISTPQRYYQQKSRHFDNFASLFGYEDKIRSDRIAMVSALAFSPDGNQLACGVSDGIRIWDVNTGEPVQTLKTPKALHDTFPLFLRFSKDGKRLFAGLMSGDFVVFDIASGTTVRTLHPGYRPVKAPYMGNSIPVDLNPDTTLMAVGRTDHVIELIETLRWQSVAELEGHRGQISSLDFSYDGTMRVWKVERGWQGKAGLKIEKLR